MYLLTLLGVVLVACRPATVAANDAFFLNTEAVQRAAPTGDRLNVDVEITNNEDEPITVRVSSIADWIDIDSDDRLELEPGETVNVHLHVSCTDVPAVRHSWLLLESRSDSLALPVRVLCEDDDEPSDAGELLSWEPPLLELAEIVRVDPEPESSAVRLDTDRDYLVLLPDDEPLVEAIGIVGGRNVVVMGGEIDIPWQGDDPSIASRRGLIVRDARGTVHVEGVLFHGEDISEGIQISTPHAVVQLQNVAVMGLRARDQDEFSDNHPDVIQTYGNVAELRIDRLSGTTDYQGLFLSASLSDDPHGPVILRRVNIRGEPTARYLFWVSPSSRGGDVELHDVWLDVPRERRGGIGMAVWPDVRADRDARPTIEELEDDALAVTWPESMSPRIIGTIRSGTPPGGDFAPLESIGVGYESPGYRLP